MATKESKSNPPAYPQGASKPEGGVSVRAEWSFAGPLPPPPILEGYDRVCPGAAQRILDWVEQEGSHRRSLEETAVNAQVESMRREFREARVGQFCATVITLAFVVAGAYMVTTGQPVAGTIFGGVGLSGIVTAFIYGRTKRQLESPSNQKLSPPQGKRK